MGSSPAQGPFDGKDKINVRYDIKSDRDKISYKIFFFEENDRDKI